MTFLEKGTQEKAPKNISLILAFDMGFDSIAVFFVRQRQKAHDILNDPSHPRSFPLEADAQSSSTLGKDGG